jgi:amino acid adenylation domain-containing protein
LNARADLLARCLRAEGISRDDVVGLYLPRNLDLAVAVLGTMKAGGACLPLDREHSPARLKYFVSSAQARLLLTTRLLRDTVPEGEHRVLALEDVPPVHEGNGRPGVSRDRDRADNLAYVTYTSGSAGHPKGVAMPHRPLVNLVHWQRSDSRSGPGSRTLQFASLGFDVSFQEMFATWDSGGALVVVPEESRRDLFALWRLIDNSQIERILVPFVVLAELALVAESLRLWPKALREVITAGESLRITPAIRGLFRRLKECHLINQYGPTETHVVTSFSLQGRPDAWPELPPIGRPIHNARIYILDAQRQPVPVGAKGELYIGGECVARGYLNQPELTAQRFLPDPFSQANGARLYRTGDLARYRPDGKIEFLGRADHQAKIRGFRVEPGEIEVVLSRHPDVEAAVVVTDDRDGGHKRLVAYVTGRYQEPPDLEDLRRYLRDVLPDYMIPSSFVPLAALPVTPRGKVDRHRLPAAPPDDRGWRQCMPPGDDLEATLCDTWTALLGRERVGVHDDFFELGGHSLMAVQMLARINSASGVQLTLATLLRNSTIQQLADQIRGHAAGRPVPCVVAIQPHGSRVPLFLLHSAFGDLLMWRNMLPYFPPDQPVYGVQPPRQGGDLESFSCLEELAARYVSEIIRAEPRGPYALAGYSFGGNFAFEIAQQLRARRADVALLAIIDTETGLPAAMTFRKRMLALVRCVGNLPRWVANDLLCTPPIDLYSRARVKLRAALRRLGRALRQSDSPTSEERYDDAFDVDRLPTAMRDAGRHHFGIWTRYVTRRYPGRITVFRAQSRPLFHSYQPDLGWGAVAEDGVDVKVVPGNHNSILIEPNCRTLARELALCLDSTDCGPSNTAHSPHPI